MPDSATLALVAQHCSLAVTVGDEQDRIVWANPAFERCSGHALAEVVGRKACELLLGPATDPIAIARLREALAARQPARGIETLNYSRTGEARWLSIDLHPLESGWLMMITDISARRAAETAASEARGRLRSMIDRVPLGALEYEVQHDDTLVLVNANRIASRVLRVDCRKKIGLPIEQAFPPLAATALPELYRAVALSGMPLERRQLEYRDADIGGEFEFVAFQVAPRRVVVVFRDVTEERRLEGERERSEALRQLVFDAVPEPLALTRHATGAYLEVNRAWVEVYGVPRDEAIGRNAEQLGLWRNPAQRRQMRDQLSLERSLRELEIPFLRRGGGEVLTLVSAALIDSPAGEIAIWLTRDVSEQRRLAARLAATLANTPGVAIQWYDADGRVLLWNTASEKFYGIAADDALGRPIGELIYTPEQSAEFVRLLAQAEPGGRPSGPLEITVTRRDGARLDIIYTLFRIPGEGGEPIFACMDIDVSEQRRAEAELRAGEARYRALFENARDPIFLLRGGRVIDCNPAASTAFKSSRAELIDTPIEALSPPIQPDGRVSAAAVRALVAAAQLGEDAHTEWRHRRRDGSEFDSEVGLSRAMVLGEALVLAVVRDVSQRRAAEAQAKSLADRLQVTAAATGIGLWEYDIAARRLSSDAQHKRLHGLPADFAGDLLPAVLSGGRPDDIDRLRNELQRAASGEQSFWSGEFEIRWPDGSCHWLNSRAQVVCDAAGVPVRLLGVSFDTTAAKQTELELRRLAATLESRVAERGVELERAMRGLMQSEKLAALGGLVAGVAHELNTPIGNSLLVASGLADSLKGLADATAAGLRRSELDDYLGQSARATALLVRNLQRAAELIASFKQVAVDQSGAQRRRFALDELVTEIAATLAPSLKGTPYRIETGAASGIQMDSYPGALGQVLTNLVTNAVRHGFEGRDTGCVLITAHPAGEAELVLRVSDDGCGIAAAEIDRIFEPFYTSKLGQGGSGLGLHIVHSLLDGVLGGRISVESELGHGTSFIVALPRVAPHAPAAAPGDHSAGR